MAKSILIKAVINGCGIVNFDSNDQKSAWNRQRDVEINWHDNVSFGKGRYYTESGIDKDGEEIEYLRKVAVISADCIRHAMYDDCMSIHLPNIMHDDGLLLTTISHPAFIERGYMFARKGKTNWKRKSGFCLSYAKATNSSVPALETYSNSQPKTGENKSEDQAETSFFKREVRGDTVYELSGMIDIGELGFISLSEVHDRLSFDSDYADKYRSLLGSKLGSDISAPAFFQKNGDAYNIPEQGIQLNQEQVKALVVDILKRLSRFSITRSVTGNAQTTSVSIKVINNPLEDFHNDPEGWVEVFGKNKFDVSALDGISFDSLYTKVKLQDEALQMIANYKKKFGYTEPAIDEKEEPKTKAKAKKR